MRQKICFTQPFFLNVVLLLVLLTACSTENIKTTAPAPSATFLDVTPTFLPHVGKIVFYSTYITNDGRNTETSVVDADGSSPAQLVEPNPLTWSPNEQYITFGRNYNIYIRNVKTKVETRITPPDIKNISQDIWSPDSKKIAIISLGNENKIYIADIEKIQQGISVEGIKVIQDNVSASELVWSPDSKYILFVYRFQTHESDTVVILNTVTGDKTALNSGWSHAWSPDGRQIIFVGGLERKGDIYLLNYDDKSHQKFQDGELRLTDNNADDELPVWSPDGKQIVFASTRDHNWEVYMMNADGSNQRNLTNNPAYDSSPVWSPDGKQIAFVSNRDGNQEIYVMNADGSHLLRLTNNDVDDWAPVWQPQP